jgi:hypothetical protein
MRAGALQVSLAMCRHVYPDIMLGVYSKAATCVRQTMCTVTDRAIPSYITTISTTLATCHLRLCMSNKLIFLIYSMLTVSIVLCNLLDSSAWVK